jgi:serine/threonine-protein kinase
LPLAPGTRLGSYEILSLLGSGGMGEVYRAKDTKLGRDVALKILPASFTNDPDRVARFRREAQVLASLNHPHIGQIYGLEEANGTQFLVLELVDGESLGKRIAHGPIPVDEALEIAKQIAEALEAAHEKGIIHRDLKPANIALTKDGSVKVLDFGLAKAVETTSGSSLDVTNSPTITSPAMMTDAGVILGTAAYMSPEQAKGRAADKRSDIWAFGCVIYEMFTGKRAFDGEDVSDTLAAVLRGEPDWSALPATVAPAIRTLVQRCLEKDRARRLSEISTTRFLLTETITFATAVPGRQQPVGVRPPLWQRAATPVGAWLVGMVMAGAGVWLASRPAAPRVTRLAIPTSGAAALSVLGRDLTFTADGLRVIYVGNNQTQLFVRRLDALEPAAVATGSDLRSPFVSPDGQWIGFADGLELKKVPLAGGPVVPLARLDSTFGGATWSSDDMIIFATVSSRGLQRISSAGGMPTLLAKPDRTREEGYYLWPELLPGGRAVMYTIVPVAGSTTGAQVAARDLRTGDQKMLVRDGGDAHYVPSGHLVYTAANALYAVLFDVRRLDVRGTPVLVVPRVVTAGDVRRGGVTELAVASDGTLAYLDAATATSPDTARTLVWADRVGHEQPIAAPAHPYLYPRLSPDGTRVAVSRRDQSRDIWIWDLRATTLTPLTLDPAINQLSVWTRPDGQRVIFQSNREDGINLWWQAADGSGTAERLTTSANVQAPTSVSTDGKELIFVEITPTMGLDLMRLSLDGSRRVTPLLQTRFNELNGAMSPDGHWLAYQSDRAGGRYEIYVQPYPHTGEGQRQISTEGGAQPVWARSGRELFYLAPDGSLMSVAVETSGDAWRAKTPVQLFQGRYDTRGPTPLQMYDVSPDGQQFLMLKAAGTDQTGAPPTIVVVQHFDEELKRLVPVK